MNEPLGKSVEIENIQKCSWKQPQVSILNAFLKKYIDYTDYGNYLLLDHIFISLMMCKKLYDMHERKNCQK